METPESNASSSKDRWTLVVAALVVGVLLVVNKEHWLPHVSGWLLEHHILVESGWVQIPALGALDGIRLAALGGVLVTCWILARIVRRALAA